MSERNALALALTIMAGLLVFMYTIDFARGADGHTHEGAIGHFYQSWMMPSNRAISCCHEQDCSPAEAYQKNGQWFARKQHDLGEFTPIDPQKVETDRDSPDGRSHLCGRRYGFNNNNFSVFCFIAGAGG